MEGESGREAGGSAPPRVVSTVRVSAWDGSLLGAGILVAPQYVLTAAHVVGYEGRRAADTDAERTTEVFLIGVPGRPDGAAVPARVEAVHGAAVGPPLRGADFGALLRLAKPLEGVLPASLGTAGALPPGTLVHGTHGSFRPRAEPDVSRWRIQGFHADGVRMALSRAEHALPDPEPLAAGSAIVDPQVPERVLGMVLESAGPGGGEGAQVATMVPSEQLTDYRTWLTFHRALRRRTPRHPPSAGLPEPRLRTGEVLGDRYRVMGPLALGGGGWLHLAEDAEPEDSGRSLVVLKELVDGDFMAPEREFRSLIRHPNIVRIQGTVARERPDGRGESAYVVMEHVPGPTLRDVVRAARTGGPPLLIEQAVAFGIQLLDVLAYLHGLGLLYCDLKPGNVILQGGRLKLIDLGAVRRMDDQHSPAVGTPHYQVAESEIHEHGLTVRSDIHTVGTTLRALVEVVAWTGDEDTDAWRALRRVLDRATAEYAERYASTEEMCEELTQVLDDLLAERRGTPMSVRAAGAKRVRAALEQAVAAGDMAYEEGETADATREWGLAVSLAHALDERAVPTLLRRVADVIDPARGVIRLKDPPSARHHGGGPVSASSGDRYSSARLMREAPTAQGAHADPVFVDAHASRSVSRSITGGWGPRRTSRSVSRTGSVPRSRRTPLSIGNSRQVSWGPDDFVLHAPPPTTLAPDLHRPPYDAPRSVRAPFPLRPPALSEPRVQRLGSTPARVGAPTPVAFALAAPAALARYRREGAAGPPPDLLPGPVKLRVLLDAGAGATSWPVTRLVELALDRTTETVAFEVVPTEAGPLPLTFRVYRDTDSELLMEVRAELDVLGAGDAADVEPRG